VGEKFAPAFLFGVEWGTALWRCTPID